MIPYTADKTTAAENGRITNTLKTKQLKVSKSWTNSADQTLGKTVVEQLVDLKAIPSAIRFEIYYSLDGGTNYIASGKTQRFTTKELAAGTKTLTLYNVPIADGNGNEIKYKLVEKEVSYDGNNWVAPTTDNITVTGETTIGTNNTGAINNQIQTGTISVTKNWDDNNDQDGKRASKVTVTLKRDGEVYGSSVELSASNNWTKTWTNLPVYKRLIAGEKSNWTIEETSVDGYTTTYTVSVDGAEETVYVGGSNKNLTEGGSLAFTVTNKHIPELRPIAVKKVWEDNNNRDKKRSSSVTVELVKDGVPTGQTKTLSADNNWEDSFTGLDKYRDHGVEIQYTVQENLTDTEKLIYTWAVTGNMVSGYTVTNTHGIEKTRVDGVKTWDDADNQDNVRPTSITVYLFADGTIKDYQVVTPDANGDWKYSFTGLDKYREGEEGVEIVYTVDEADITTGEYNVDIDGYNIKNTHTPEPVTISGKKDWKDENNQDNIRPGHIVINLYADGTQVNTMTVDDTDNWNYTFTTDVAGKKLPKYKNVTNPDGTVTHGVKVEYTVTETKVDGYETEIDGFTVINTHIPRTKSVDGVKIWKDNDNRDGKRPEEITVNLLADGVQKQTKTIKADADGNWKYSFDNLPVYKNVTNPDGTVTHGVEIDYTVTENVVKYYTTEIVGTTITNNIIPETTKVEGSKEWRDNDNRDKKRPSKIIVNLLADGEVDQSKEVTGTGNTWSYSFTDLQKYKNVTNPDGTVTHGVEIQYTVNETPVEYYETTVIGTTIINEHKPDTTSVDGEKTWEDDSNRDGKRPTSITVYLYADKASDSDKPVRQQTVKPAADGSWKYSFTDLQKYRDGEEGVEIVYTVEEEPVGAYEATVTGYNIKNTHKPETTKVEGSKEWYDNNNRDQKRPSKIIVNLLADGEKVDSKEVTGTGNTWSYSFDDLPKYQEGEVGHEIKYTVTEDPVEFYETSIVGTTIINEHEPETTRVDGEKIWDDDSNRDGLRPTQIFVYLYADKTSDSDEPVQTKKIKVAADGTWKYSFTNLPKYRDGKVGEEIVYTVEEEPVDNYTTTIKADNTEIKNTHVPEKVSVPVRKDWDDDSNRDGLRIAVTVHLWSDDNAAGTMTDTGKTVTLTKDNGWSDEFTGLNKYRAERILVNYEVREDSVANYTFVETTGDQVDGFVIKNRHIPERINIPVEKKWTDDSNRDGLRKPVTVHLYADGVDTGKTVVLAKDNNYKASFENLLKYRDEGIRIQYTVVEDEVEDYTYVTTTGTMDDGYTVENKHEPELTEVPVVKAWSDDDDRDGLRDGDREAEEDAMAVTVRLYADGEPTGDVLVLDKDNDWSGKFTGLFKYKAERQLIQYTITEDEVAAYTPVITGDQVGGYTVTNVHVPERIAIDVEKLWDDESDRDGIRDAKEITIALLADGVETGDEIVLTKDNGWKGSFDNLLKYRNEVDEDGNITKHGVEIIYTVAERDVEDYTLKEITGNQTDGYKVTNRHVPERIEIPVTKSWDDDDDRDGIRSKSIKVQLYADGSKDIPVDDEGTTTELIAELTEENGWVDTTTFTNLYKYRNTVDEDGEITEHGVEIVYTWEEIEIEYDDSVTSTGYKASGEGMQATAPSEDAEGEEPPVVEPGEEDGIMVNDEGTDPEGRDPEGTPETPVVGGFAITNTHTPEAIEIPVVKTWVDDDNAKNLRPLTIRFTLYADGTAVASKEVSAEDDWKYTFTEDESGNYLKKYRDHGVAIEYTVTEEPIEYYVTKVDGFEVTNTITSVYVSKVCVDENGQDVLEDLPGATISVLDGSGAVVDTWESGTTAHEVTGLAKGVVYTLHEVNADNMAPERDGKEGYYVAYETDTQFVINDEGYIEYHGTTAKVAAMDGLDEVLLVRNRFSDPDDPPPVPGHEDNYNFLGIEKLDEDGKDLAGATFQITDEAGRIVATRTGEEMKWVTGGHDAPKYWIDMQDINEWILNHADLTLDSVFTVSEIEAPVGYELVAPVTFKLVITTEEKTRADGTKFTVTSYTFEVLNAGEGVMDSNFIKLTDPLTYTSVDVVKKWNDNKDQAAKRPEYIEVELLADKGDGNGAQVIKTEKVLAKDDWKYTFTDLPAYSHGTKIEYTVKEKDVKGYTLESSDRKVGNDLKVTVTLTNKYVPDKKPNDKDRHKGGTVKTGDESKVVDMFVLFALSLISLSILGVNGLKRKREEEE